MTKFIDFVPKRPKNTVIAHPVKVAPKTSKSTPVTPKSVKKPAPAKATPVKLTFKPAKKPAPVKPVAKPAPKSTPKPSPKPSPVPRPIVNRGLRIDFVRKAPAKTPPRAPTATPVKIATVTQKTVAISKNPVRAPKIAIKPKIVPKPEPEELEVFDEEPLMDEDDLALALAGFADDGEDSTPILTDNLSKEVSDFEDELDALDELAEDEAEITDFVEEPKPLFSRKSTTTKSAKIPDAPDANKYTLGGRSPFLTSVNVEKHPLSNLVPENAKTIKKEVRTPVKNAYRAKVKQIFKDEDHTVHRETTIVSTPEPKSHGFGLTIAIILTIILGASIGALVYLIFFQ